MKFKKIKRRGQAMVLWALLTPLLICFVGVGMDLGWYYLNVSRLQNAADAAALAGAMKVEEILNGNDLTGGDAKKWYYYGSLVDPPSDLYNYQSITLENLSNYYSSKDLDLTEGHKDANTYANKNLDESYDKAVASATAAVINSWDPSSEHKNVTFTPALYAKEIDIQKDVSGALYYGVTLTEEITHLFLRGENFKPMKAVVSAYVIFNRHDEDIKSAMDEFDRTKIIANWEYLNKHKDTYTGKWNHYQTSAVTYDKSDNTVYRTENITINSDTSDTRKNSLQKTSANGNNMYDANNVDSLNIDFRAEFQVSNQFTSDWDLGTALPTSVTYHFTNGWDKNNGYDLRIHSSITFDGTYKNRYGDSTPDPLWIRIESEPILPITDKPGHKAYNSVRQIILNMNADNTVKNDDGSFNRPLIIFYDGPEQFDKNTKVRVSQPVIINFNENFNGILYMPNSPVVINGNGHTFQGFVIAESFVRLTEESDYPNYDKFTTGYGDKLFIKTQELTGNNFLNEEQFEDLQKSYDVVTDNSGNVSVYEQIKATKHPIIKISKEEAKNYNSLPEYLDATYKAKFMATTGLTESEITTVTFPNGGKYVTDMSLPVATADISTTQKDNNYVEVFVNGAKRYIDKRKLPYVKVRRNGTRPYVSIYDIHSKRLSSDYGLNTIDESIEVHDVGSTYDSSADIWRPTTDTYKSDMFINKSLMDGTYVKNYVDSKLKIEDGYFMLKSEIESEKQSLVAEYWKVKNKNGETRYINKNVTIDYTETIPEGSENPIIVDSKGNLQVKEKPLSDPSYNATRPTNNDEIPLDTQRIANPSVEVVYLNTAFNLNDASRYSSFGIPELKRVIYKYLDKESPVPVDMFFTTERAAWID